MTACPICKLDNQNEVATLDAGDKITYNCARCGRYTISRTASAIVNRENKTAQLSAWIREKWLYKSEIPMLTSTFIKDVLTTLPEYDPLEKQFKLLKAIALQSDYPGKEVVLLPDHDVSLAWAENSNEFTFYLQALMDRGFLKLSQPGQRVIGDPLCPVIITTDGWEYLDKDTTDLLSKSQAFIAMSFDKDLYSIYKNAIAPAVESTGFNPYRVDAVPHIERIDAKIISEIKNSRFMVADVTQQKAGVYYEAGYAQGMGIPVIWCVRNDYLDSVHFDTRQFNHIVWESENDYKIKLKDIILAVIGKR